MKFLNSAELIKSIETARDAADQTLIALLDSEAETEGEAIVRTDMLRQARNAYREFSSMLSDARKF